MDAPFYKVYFPKSIQTIQYAHKITNGNMFIRNILHKVQNAHITVLEKREDSREVRYYALLVRNCLAW